MSRRLILPTTLHICFQLKPFHSALRRMGRRLQCSSKGYFSSHGCSYGSWGPKNCFISNDITVYALQRALALGLGIHLDLGNRRSPVLTNEGDLSLIICIFSSLWQMQWVSEVQLPAATEKTNKWPMLMLHPYAKSLHKVPLCSAPRWIPGERWPWAKGATREGREGLCLLMECCPGPGRSESFFHCFLSQLTEVCRSHILKLCPPNQLHSLVLLLRTCGPKFYDQISLSLKCLHWAGSKTWHGWVCSPRSHRKALPLASSAFCWCHLKLLSPLDREETWIKIPWGLEWAEVAWVESWRWWERLRQ